MPTFDLSTFQVRARLLALGLGTLAASLPACAITINQSSKGSEEPRQRVATKTKRPRRPVRAAAAGDDRTASVADADSGEPARPRTPARETKRPVRVTPDRDDVASARPDREPQKPEREQPSGDLGAAAPAKEPTDSDLSHLGIPLRVPFEGAMAKLDALIPQTDEETEWTRASKAGDSPEVDIKYKLWRDKLRASYVGDTLKLTVRLHYAANFRVKVRNPIARKDWIWLTRDDTWGTTSDPQDLTLVIELKPRVEPDFRIASDPTLQPLIHGPIPPGDVCVRVGIKTCVSRSNLAPKIRARIDSKLTPKLKAALSKVDPELNALLNPRERAEQVWKALQQPQPLQEIAQAKCPTVLGKACEQPAWFVATPEAISVRSPRLDGDDLRVDLSLTGRMAAVVGDKPRVEVRPLPKLGTKPASPEVLLHLELSIPTPTLSKLLSKALKGREIAVGDKGLVLKGASVTAARDGKDPRRITIRAKASGVVSGELTLSGRLGYDRASQSLRVSDLTYDEATAKLLRDAVGADRIDAVRKQLAELTVWKLAGQAKLLEEAAMAAIGKAIRGDLELDGKLDELAVHDLAFTEERLALKVSLLGQLAVRYVPR